MFVEDNCVISTRDYKRYDKSNANFDLIIAQHMAAVNWYELLTAC